MATTGPKTFRFRSCRGRMLVKLLIVLAVIGVLTVSTFFTIKLHKKVKILFHDMEDLQLSQSRMTTSYGSQIYSLNREVEGLKSTIKARNENEEIFAVQIAELKATQALSRREIERLTLVNKGYEVTLQELSDKYTRLMQANEHLTRQVELIEEMGSQVIRDMKAELNKKLDSANFGQEVVKIVEEVLRQKLQEEFNRMFQERKEIAHHKEELEGKVGFVKALDAQSALTKPYPEVVEKVNVEKKETSNENDKKSNDPFDISDTVIKSSEEEIMKKRQEAIDLRVAELVEMFNKKLDGGNDVSKEKQKMNKEEEEKAKLLDPFYIEEVDVPVKPKAEVKKEKVPEVPNPNDPFYIEETTGEKGVSYEEVREKIKDLVDKTKKEFQAAGNYVKDNLPAASNKIKDIGKEIKEKTKHQVDKLAEKAKKASKAIMSLFNR